MEKVKVQAIETYLALRS